VLERQFAAGSVNSCGPVHRSSADLVLHAQRERECARHGSQSRACSKSLGPLDMHRQIEIAEPEPRLAAESAHAVMNCQDSLRRPQPSSVFDSPDRV
jgi:hypothetical protein